MGRHLSIAIRLAVVTLIVFGVIYPLAITGIAQVLFPAQANGSLVRDHGRVIGSKLIGQKFIGREYFHPRPSASNYDATASGGSNLGPTSKALSRELEKRVNLATHDNPGLKKGEVPADMVTASASGLDPDISPNNAYAQAARVAKARGVSEAAIRKLINRNITGRTFGFLGEPRVNVLKINMELDKNR